MADGGQKELTVTFGGESKKRMDEMMPLFQQVTGKEPRYSVMVREACRLLEFALRGEVEGWKIGLIKETDNETVMKIVEWKKE